jgi:methionyl-tRNA formyltransferase
MDIKKLKIVYFGTPDISAKVLKHLIEDGFNIVGLVTQIDKPQGRKNIITPPPTKVVAMEHGIKVYQPVKIRNDYEFLKEIQPDIILTLAYGQLIPHELLELPKIGAFNLHGSILPKHRGASPIQYSLLEGDKETGVTLMEMVDKMDAGKMFYVSKFNITDDDNYSSLKEKISDAAYDAFINGIQDVVDGKNKGVEQDENLVTFTAKINKEDEVINFNSNNIALFNKIRALSYEPGMYFVFNNEKIKILKTSIVSKNGKPGEVLEYSKNGFIIATLDGALSVDEIQKPSKKVMNFKDFYNGNQNLFKVGQIL